MKIIKITAKDNKEDIANYIFALYIVFIPILISLAGFFSSLKTDAFLMLFSISYIVFLIIKLKNAIIKKQISKKTIKAFFKKPLIISFCFLFLFAFISSIINGFNIELLTYISFPLIILCFYFLDKAKAKKLIFMWIIIIGICCIMGYIDSKGTFMPGFNVEQYPLSLQFNNPNYSAEIVATTLIINCFMFLKTEKISLRIFYFISFLNFALFLFLNGSFMSITAVFIVLVVSLILFLIKNKRYAKWIILFLFSMISLSIIVDLIPFLYQNRSTTFSNYFVEILGAIDNHLGTNLLQFFGVTNQHGIDISAILGFDGWDRQELWENAVSNILNKPLFGYGAGSFNTFRPHNVFLSLSLDFGLAAAFSYVSIVVCLFTTFFKNKNKNLIQYALLMAILANVVIGLLGSLIASAHLFSFVCVGLFLNKKVSFENNSDLFQSKESPLSNKKVYSKRK